MVCHIYVYYLMLLLMEYYHTFEWLAFNKINYVLMIICSILIISLICDNFFYEIPGVYYFPIIGCVINVILMLIPRYQQQWFRTHMSYSIYNIVVMLFISWYTCLGGISLVSIDKYL